MADLKHDGMTDDRIGIYVVLIKCCFEQAVFKANAIKEKLLPEKKLQDKNLQLNFNFWVKTLRFLVPCCFVWADFKANAYKEELLPEKKLQEKTFTIGIHLLGENNRVLGAIYHYHSQMRINILDGFKTKLNPYIKII